MSDSDTLGNAFPTYTNIPTDGIMELVEVLLREPGGSFAVTTDAPEGQRKLWMSEAAFKLLTEEGARLEAAGIPPRSD